MICDLFVIVKKTKGARKQFVKLLNEKKKIVYL